MLMPSLLSFLLTANFYQQDFPLRSIDDDPVSLSTFQGQVSLVVNTASKCGFTSQYEQLQKLFSTYQSRGFVVLGFPSNDFGQQEPGTAAEIKSFCKTNYGVTFPLFAKASVRGEEKQPVFKYLTEASRKDLRGEISWNFEKFLIGRDGEVVARFPSSVSPLNEVLVRILEGQLKHGKSPIPVAEPAKPAVEVKPVKQ